MERTLLLYNTATRSKEEFRPQNGEVGMYCCGPTVYNYAHIGNLRTYIFEDVLKRALLSLGFKVTHVTNITDVGHLTSDADTGEDKMEKGARSEGKSVWDIAKYYTDQFMANIKDLNILQPNVWPKATDHIAEMIAQIKVLEEKGFTYKTADGIYFDTSKFPRYGNFAGIDSESLKAGVRVDMGEKRNPTDFALWKFSPKDAKRQMEWNSPWGVGFPGWHIECSAMSQKYLKLPIDIHCGGIDHVRVHHTNEIAQSEAANGAAFVRFWVHGEWLNVDKGKMAKSSGNFLTLNAIGHEGISPLAYRMFCYSAHYRSPLLFSLEGARAAVHSLSNLKKLVAAEVALADQSTQSDSQADPALAPFWEAVDDDLNMPKAVAAVWELLRTPGLSSVRKVGCVREMDKILGLDLLVPERIDRYEYEVGEPGAMTKIICQTKLGEETVRTLSERASARRRAKKEKNFAAADAIRQDLQAQGVELKDLPGGITECRVASPAINT